MMPFTRQNTTKAITRKFRMALIKLPSISSPPPGAGAAEDAAEKVADGLEEAAEKAAEVVEKAADAAEKAIEE